MIKQTQMKYVIERLDKTFQEKVRIISKEMEGEIGKLQREAIKKKAFEIKINTQSWRNDLRFEVEFPKLTKTVNKLQADAAEKELKLRIKMLSIKDEIMLGDEQTALKSIQDFEKLNV